LTDYLRILKRVENATQETGLVGIHAVIVHVSSNVRMWKTQARALTPDERDVLARWPVFVMNYLAAPGQFEVCAQIHAWLRSPLWIHDLPDYELDRIERDLHTPVVTIKQEPLAPRVQQAHREDVLIAPPQDANAKLLDTLSQELQQHAAEFSACINRIAQGHGTPLDVESAQRSAHTLKGAANTVGVTGIATLTHHIEDILSVYARQQRVPDGSAAATLLAAADVLEMMSEALLGRGNAPAHAQASLQDIIDLANRIDADGLPNTTEPALLSLPVPRAADSLSGAEKKPTAAGEKNETLLRVPASVLNDLLSLVGESIVMTGQLQERLRLSLNQSRIGAEQHLLLQQLHDELEQHVAMHHTSALETERHNELCSVTRRILEAATDARENSRQLEDHLAVFADLIPALVRVNRGSQEAVMSTRMVPVSSIAPRLQRSVRQTCRATGKHASLTVSGADTLLDSDILDELVDPLMHLLRNAIDHGIEPAASRLSAGKSETGSIKLTFARDGDHLVVSCSDDGAGLDYVRIQQVALQKGLLAANKQFSEEELSRMILLPGFTTRNESTQTSGRGIGLDAVYSSVVRMKGSLAIRSQPQGCSFEMHIPLTLMSIHALLVQSRAQVLAISSRCVEQILPVGSGQVQVDGTCLHYRVGEESYEAYEIERLLHLPLDRSWLEHGDRPVLLVRDNTGHLRAVFVENVLASQDLVVKQLGPYLPSILGIEGATILGSGGVAAVIDLPGLLQTAQSGQLAPLLAALDPAATPSAAPLALVVDDSVSARRALAEFAKDMGFEVITANDGVAALEVVKSKTPSLVLTDMEMPRLNGIELIEQLRLIPGTQPVPIIMVSSRSTKKHHELALKAGANVYMTKPFNEDELAEHIRKLTHLVTES
jgi:chemosensory pili system protein ChpA (sensor histidine kinase/response regulator)